MPTDHLIDPDRLAALRDTRIGVDGIRRVIPQRDAMEQLQGILLFDPDQGLVVGYKDVRRDEFWTSGHMPGRPLFPGVLMIEAAAQLCTFFYRTRIEESRDRQYGFGALDRVRFRGTVKPGDRLLLVAKVRQLRKKFFFFDTQAFVGTRLVYEGEITGIELPSNGDTTA